MIVERQAERIESWPESLFEAKQKKNSNKWNGIEI